MSRMLIDRDDYNTLIHLLEQMISEDTDCTVKSIFEEIRAKYSVKSQINEIKAKLYSDITKYEQGTRENKKAYRLYQEFSKYINEKSKSIEQGNLSLDELNFELEKMKSKSD